jgi:gamma-glutamyl hercynylcysteine S-oxide synthase
LRNLVNHWLARRTAHPDESVSPDHWQRHQVWTTILKRFILRAEFDTDRFKWLETRHMVDISHRWNRDKTDDLQFAFFNGVGWESWENIWGIWNGITPRDGEASRRVGAIERGIARFPVSTDWEPMSPLLRYGVFASRWSLGGETVWTIVNRNEYDVEGDQMEVPWNQSLRYFDLYHGAELKPQARPGGKMVLVFSIEAKGYGAVLATNAAPDQKVAALMSKMKKLTATPLANYSHQWKVVTQQIVPMAATRTATGIPEGMIKVPDGDFLFRVSGIEIEGFNDIGVDVQYPWEDSPRRFHEHLMHVKSFYIDKYPVTNTEFKKFLDSTHYQPNDDLNFLRDWKDESYPERWENKPVTWVSPGDARGICELGRKTPAA